MAPPLVWLITGTSSGLGRQLGLEALKRGDKVIATGRARSIAELDYLKEQGADIVELDVTSPLETLQDIAKAAVSINGKVDVLVNNAGQIRLTGVIEETTPQETFDQFNTNLFGALNVARAFLPYMREKRTGTVIFIGSIYGRISSPYAGLYGATKWALRGISQTLHDEISPIGLRSICIDFGHFRTPIIANSPRGRTAGRIADYQEITGLGDSLFEAYNGKQPGNPVRGIEIVVDVVSGEGSAAGKAFPLGLAMGTDCWDASQKASQDALVNLEIWKDISISTDFKD